MKTKLTLSIDEDVINLAHQQAAREGTSVSKLFAGYIKDTEAKRAVPSLRDMIGSLKGYAVDDSKQAIRELYAQKYLR